MILQILSATVCVPQWCLALPQNWKHRPPPFPVWQALVVLYRFFAHQTDYILSHFDPHVEQLKIAYENCSTQRALLVSFQSTGG